MISQLKQKPSFQSFNLPENIHISKYWNLLIYLPILVLTAVAVILTLTLANPRLSDSSIVTNKSGIDIAICLDVSGSMNAVDFDSSMDDTTVQKKISTSSDLKTRLDQAKKALNDFIVKRQNDRIALIIFSGKTLNLSPPTLNHEFVLEQLKEVKIGVAGAVSTGLYDPLSSALLRLEDSNSKEKIIFLISDGAEMQKKKLPKQASGDGIKVLTPQEQIILIAKELDIKIYSLLIGSENSWIDDGRGNWIRIDHFQPGTLEQLSTESGGRLIENVSKDNFNLTAFHQDLDKKVKTKFTGQKDINYTNFRSQLIIVSIILLVLACISETVLRLNK
ncbi:MAG: VWA domain-containing protein [Lentisphaeria bacterium]|nr:VWA domain-containing protein [Lentisphaeria bacterium]